MKLHHPVVEKSKVHPLGETVRLREFEGVHFFEGKGHSVRIVPLRTVLSSSSMLLHGLNKQELCFYLSVSTSRCRVRLAVFFATSFERRTKPENQKVRVLRAVFRMFLFLHRVVTMYEVDDLYSVQRVHRTKQR